MYNHIVNCDFVYLLLGKKRVRVTKMRRKSVYILLLCVDIEDFHVFTRNNLLATRFIVCAQIYQQIDEKKITAAEITREKNTHWYQIKKKAKTKHTLYNVIERERERDWDSDRKKARANLDRMTSAWKRIHALYANKLNRIAQKIQKNNATTKYKVEFLIASHFLW